MTGAKCRFCREDLARYSEVTILNNIRIHNVDKNLKRNHQII